MKALSIANTARLAFWLPFLWVPGCSTSSFWASTGSYAEPSLPPKIEVFCAPQKNDLLVQYDELPAHKDIPRRRAYFLLENDLKIRCGNKPRFLRHAELSSLTLFRIPERQDLPASTAAPTNCYIICEGNSFSLNNPSERVPASFDLPTYKSISVPMKDLLAGPAIVASHAVVFSAIAAYYGAAGMASAGIVPHIP